MQAIRERRVVGQLEHPKDGRPNLGEAAIILTGLEIRKDGEVWGTLETLSTTAGQTATSLFEDGLSVGISSRAHGSVLRNADGIDEVQSDFLPEGFDLVAEPSTPGAYLKESLDETLGKMTPEDIKAEEQAALCEVRLEALRDEVISSINYNPLWESRLNDIAFFARQLKTDRGTALQESVIAIKGPLGKRKAISANLQEFDLPDPVYFDNLAPEAGGIGLTGIFSGLGLLAGMAVSWVQMGWWSNAHDNTKKLLKDQEAENRRIQDREARLDKQMQDIKDMLRTAAKNTGANVGSISDAALDEGVWDIIGSIQDYIMKGFGYAAKGNLYILLAAVTKFSEHRALQRVLRPVVEWLSTRLDEITQWVDKTDIRESVLWEETEYSKAKHKLRKEYTDAKLLIRSKSEEALYAIYSKIKAQYRAVKGKDTSAQIDAKYQVAARPAATQEKVQLAALKKKYEASLGALRRKHKVKVESVEGETMNYREMLVEETEYGKAKHKLRQEYTDAKLTLKDGVEDKRARLETIRNRSIARDRTPQNRERAQEEYGGKAVKLFAQEEAQLTALKEKYKTQLQALRRKYKVKVESVEGETMNYPEMLVEETEYSKAKHELRQEYTTARLSIEYRIEDERARLETIRNKSIARDRTPQNRARAQEEYGRKVGPLLTQETRELAALKEQYKTKLEALRRKYKVKVESVEGATMNYREMLIEEAEDEAARAQASADKAQAAADEVAVDAPEGSEVAAQAELAATQAKIAAAEAQAAAEAAAEAKTPEAAELAANKAAEAAADAADAEQAATGTPPPETPEATPGAKICHTVELEVDFEGLSDEVKKRLNVFRPGEPLDTFKTLISSELESKDLPVKQMDVFWSEEKLRVKVEVDGDPELATLCIDSLIAAPTEAPTEIIEPEEPMPATVESMSELLALRQRQRDLVQETQELRRSVLTLRKENDNLRILNQEMTKLFEEKMVSFTVKGLVQEDASLKKVEGLLRDCPNIPSVMEMADKFKQALLENRPAPKSRTWQSAPRKEVRVAALPIHMPLSMFPESPNIPLDESENKTSTGTPKEDNTFSRLAAYRKKMQNT